MIGSFGSYLCRATVVGRSRLSSRGCARAVHFVRVIMPLADRVAALAAKLKVRTPSRRPAELRSTPQPTPADARRN